MKGITRHLGTAVLAAAILATTVIRSVVAGRKDGGRMYLQDLAGSRSAIADIRLEGLMKDAYHSTRFALEGGAVRTATEIHADPRYVNPAANSPGMGKIMNGRIYEVQGSTPFTVVSRDWDVGQYTGARSAQVPSAVQPVRNTEEQGGNMKFANPLEYGLARIGEQVYFTVPTTLDYRGDNGIYALRFTGDSNPENRPDSKILAAFSLDGNDPASREGLEVLGLESVGDKLALIALEKDGLLVRAYDGRTGADLGEARYSGLEVAGSGFSPRQGETDSGERYNSYYQAYPDPIGGSLTLVFSKPDPDPEAVVKTWITIGLSEGAELKNAATTRFKDGEEDTFYGITAAYYGNGVLAIAKTFRETGEDQVYSPLRPRHLMVYAYRGNEQLYKGELVTDMNDDNLQGLHLPAGSGGFSYDFTEYRYVDRLDISPLSGKEGTGLD